MRYEIKIPKPCSEKWNEMTPTEKGAFCSNCKKEVLDFTNTSHFQLAKYLDNNKKICGKFKPEQLNKDILYSENNKYSKTGLLLGVSTLLSLSTPVFSQNKPPEILKVEQSKIGQKKHFTNEKLTDSIKFKGNISDINGGLPGANVILKKYSYGVQTDFDGNFSISINTKELKQNLTLVISYLGFETQEIQINDKTEFIKVKMKEDQVLLGEVVIIKKQNIFRRIGNLFRKNKNYH